MKDHDPVLTWLKPVFSYRDIRLSEFEEMLSTYIDLYIRKEKPNAIPIHTKKTSS